MPVALREKAAGGAARAPSARPGVPGLASATAAGARTPTATQVKAAATEGRGIDAA